MIRLIEGGVASFFPREMLAMHKNRGFVFGHVLGWEVNVHNGMERDSFDDENPLYLVSVDDNCDYRGSLRLLPTTGPNMLRDVFSELLDDGQMIENPNVWESSRICVDIHASDPRAVFGELVLGICEVAQIAGLSAVVTVVDKRIYRILRMLGCQFDVLGGPKDVGGISCYALRFSDLAQMETIRAKLNKHESVLEPDAVSRTIALDRTCV